MFYSYVMLCSFRRASPDGQSFRSSGDEVPADFRKQWDSAKHNGDQSDDDDDDYENVRESLLTF